MPDIFLRPVSGSGDIWLRDPTVPDSSSSASGGGGVGFGGNQKPSEPWYPNRNWTVRKYSGSGGLSLSGDGAFSFTSTNRKLQERAARSKPATTVAPRVYEEAGRVSADSARIYEEAGSIRVGTMNYERAGEIVIGVRALEEARMADASFSGPLLYADEQWLLSRHLPAIISKLESEV